jgi:hypothetical protein
VERVKGHLLWRARKRERERERERKRERERAEGFFRPFSLFCLAAAMTVDFPCYPKKRRDELRAVLLCRQMGGKKGMTFTKLKLQIRLRFITIVNYSHL